MGKGGGGGGAPPPPQSQTVTQTNLPEYARPYFENVLNRAQAESYRDYTPYEGQRVAEFTPGQTAAQQETLGMQTPGQFAPATAGTQFGTATGLGAGVMGLGAAFTDPTQMMSPYMQNVVDVQKREAITDAQKQQLMANLGSARQGTYGGARQLLAGTERERALGQQLGDIQARGLQSAYDAASQRGIQLGQLGMQGLQTGLTGAQQLGQLGAQQQQTDLSRIQAQAAAGAEQRQLEQQRMDTSYADFLRQRDFPMEQLSYYSNILRGIPVQLGSTATTYAQPPSFASQVGGLGLAGLGLYNLAKG
jgi:hypothetical protein